MLLRMVSEGRTTIPVSLKVDAKQTWISFLFRTHLLVSRLVKYYFVRSMHHFAPATDPISPLIEEQTQ
jgi:hypothetical protein